MIRCVFVFVLLVLLTGPRAATAQEDCHLLSEPVLRIEIESADATPADTRLLTRSDLTDLAQTEFTTTTIWTEGPQVFAGPWMATLLRELGAQSGDVTLTAFNDYSVTVPIDTFVEGGALLAVLRNGEPMTPRSKGPLWVVWNYDAKAEFRTESIYALSIWQLDRITISR